MQLQFQYEKPESEKRYMAVQILLTAVFAVSVIAGLFSAMEISISYGGLGLFALMASICMHVTFQLKTSFQRIVLGCMIFMAVLSAVFFAEAVRTGVAVICNQVMTIAGAENGSIYLPFTLNPEVNPDFAVFIVGSLFVILLTVAVAQLQRAFHPWIMAVAGLLLLLLNGCLPQKEGGMWLLISILCMGIYYAWNRLGDKKLLPSLALLLLALTCVFWIAGSFCKEDAESWKQDMTTAAHERLEDRIKELRYGEDENRSMPMGDFRELENLEFSDASMLKICGETYSSFYMRGYVGGDFTGEQWKPLDGKTLYQKADTFYWLHKEGYFGQNLLAKTASILEPDVKKKNKTYRIEVTGADSRVYYTPYELTGLQNGDESLLVNSLLTEDSFWASGWKGAKEYEIETLDNQVKRYPTLIGVLIDHLEEGDYQSFRKAESHYNRFVYENYRTLTDSERKLLEKYLGKQKVDDGTHMDYEEAKTEVLRCLDTYVAYSEKLPNRSAGATFLQDFLEVNKTGYSVHYATAATLMLRHFGIPARYVEGYLVTPDAAKKAEGAAVLNLTDKDAHAWVEYYQDGIGWIPFEVTPPYRDVMEVAETTQSADGSQTVQERVSSIRGMEMIEDNYEEKEIEKEERNLQIPWGRMLYGGIIIFFLLFAAVIGRYLWNRRRKLLERQKSFQQEDMSKATAAIFHYCLALQQAMGIQQRNISIYAYESEIESLLGKEMASAYDCVAKIYQKAVYSRGTLSEEEKHQAILYKDGLLAELKQRGSLWNRFLWKWQKGLY